MPIVDCLLPISATMFQIGNRYLAIGNVQTRRRGQGAECPDRFITKKRLIARRFFRNNASASIPC